MNRKSGRIYTKRQSFAQVSNTALRDNNLSLKAKGLLAVIESYLTLDNFILYREFLLSQSTDGETSFRGAWKELKDNGYLIQRKLKDNVTKQFYYEYEICDSPEVQKPQVDFQHVGIQQVVNPPYGNPTCSEQSCINNTIHNNIINNNTILTNILTNIDYETVFVGSLDKELVDNIVNVMVGVLSCEDQQIKLGDSLMPMKIVKDMFLKVNMTHIQYVVNTIRTYTKPIKNVKNFIISTLYNSVLTLGVYYENRFISDQAQQ